MTIFAKRGYTFRWKSRKFQRAKWVSQKGLHISVEIKEFSESQMGQLKGATHFPPSFKEPNGSAKRGYTIFGTFFFFYLHNSHFSQDSGLRHGTSKSRCYSWLCLSLLNRLPLAPTHFRNEQCTYGFSYFLCLFLYILRSFLTCDSWTEAGGDSKIEFVA